MADNQFKIIIGADGSPLTKTLAELQADLKKFQAQLQTAKDPAFIISVNKALKETHKNISILKNLSTSNALRGIKPVANEAGQALTDFNRIVQDVPFGFVGIQNNIQPLIDSFGRVKAQTGSTAAALKSMAGSLIGPAGIGLAIAAASSAFLILQNGISGFNKKAKEATDKTKELIDSFRSVSDIEFDAQGSVAAQKIKVDSLTAAVNDLSLSEKERMRALNDLKSINKSYFGDLNLTDVALGKVTKATDEYTNALIRNAISRELEGEIGKVGAAYFKQLAAVNKLNNELNKLKKNQEDSAPKLKQGEFFVDQSDTGVKLASAINKVNLELSEQQKLLRPLSDQFGTLKGELENYNLESLKHKPLELVKEGTKKADQTLKDYSAELDFLNTRIADSNRLREEGLLSMAREREALQDQMRVFDLLKEIDSREVLLGLKPKLEIDPSLFQLQIEQAHEDFQARMRGVFVKPTIITPNFEVGNFDYFEKLAEAVRKQAEGKEIGIDIPLTINPIGESNVTRVFDGIKTELEGVDFDKSFEPMIKSFNDSAKRARNQMEIDAKTEFIKLELAGPISSALSAAGEALGAALVTGANPFASAAEAFLEIVGTVVTQFGEQMIALGVEMAVAKAAIEASITNPAVAIAAGVALTILGGAMKNIKFNVPGAAEGGMLTGPKSGYLAMLHGTEMITPIDKVNEMMGGNNLSGEFVLVQRGEDLRYALSLNDKKRSRR